MHLVRMNSDKNFYPSNDAYRAIFESLNLGERLWNSIKEINHNIGVEESGYLSHSLRSLS